jgi:ABC-type transport system involved in multi-copper enzyme maturation permease subunit
VWDSRLACPPVNPLLEIGLIVSRELRKNFRSVKGIILIAISLLGGTAIALGLMKLEEFKRTKLADVSPEAIRGMREEALGQFYADPAMGKYLADAPEVLLIVLNITVWLGPMLIALLGFDSISGDVQHRSVRYWTVRSRRWSYMVGKFFGLWTIVSAITLVMHAFIWVLVVARGDATVGTTLAWGVRFWLVTLPISAAWCGIATLIGSLFRSPILALLVTFAAFFVVWLVYVIGGVSGTEAMMFVYPNNYDKWLLSPRIERVGAGFGICATFAAATMGLGSFLFSKRDV